MAFTHLHVHTEYSLLDGKTRIKDIVPRLKELGMTSCAITDHGVMYGTVAFYKELESNGIKPIIGCEVYVAPGSRHDKTSKVKIDDSTEIDDKYYHLILLAENNVGLTNLNKICSIGFTEGFYYKPRVDKEILRQYHEGIICLSACLAGEVPQRLLKKGYEDAKAAALEMQEIFGKDNYFIEIQDHGIREERMVLPDLVRLANEIGAELVATNDSHYTTKEESVTHDILLCMQTGKKLNDEKRLKFETDEFYLKSEEEMRELFRALPQACDNTNKIAERCNAKMEFGTIRLPVYEQPKEFATSFDYFRHLCIEGAKKRYGNPVSAEIMEKIEYELSVINQMGYTDYFLIVWDFINFAKQRNIPVGPGRGSGAGSICAYVIEITNIDPIKYELFFERFLNPERVSMPDFDIDFCVDRVNEVEDYVRNKYGDERVSHVITYQTMATKASVKDVGRVLDYPYSEVDKISKIIPKDAKSLDDALKISPDLKMAYDNDPRVKKVIDIAKQVEGMPKSTSQHAAGVLICDKAIEEYAPIMTVDGVRVIQARKEEVEDLGLLKFDFLRLRTLTVIDNTLKMIEKRTGEKINIDNIDMEDQKVFENLSTGKMYGVFQFESSGMKSTMANLKPTCIEDLTAVISLYRPGPMESIPRYIQNKFHPEQITYYHPCVEDILKPTYGCLVYQEQIMKVFQVMAGFTLGRADIVRRAMSKKKESILNKEFEIFLHGLHEKDVNIEGALSKGIPEDVCHRILNDMTDFSKYAFNKSHAACYAVVAYQTAWLVTYYPVEYFAAYLSSYIGDNDNLKKKCFEVKRDAGIDIIPPNINISETYFVPSEGKLTFGLGALSGVGPSTTDVIVRERKENGPYKNLFNFIERLGDTADKKACEALIKSGSMDVISEGHNRNELMAVYPMYKLYVQQESISHASGQMNLFDFLGEEAKTKNIPAVPSLPDFDSDTKLRYEKETAYMYLSEHPLSNYRKWIKNSRLDEITEIIESLEEADGKYTVGQNVVLPAMISGDISRKSTKNNTQICFFGLADEGSEINAVGFDTFVNKYGYIIQPEKSYVFKAKLDMRDESPQLIINEVIMFPRNNEEIDNFMNVIRTCEKQKQQQVYHQNQSTYRQESNMHNQQNNTQPEEVVYRHGVYIKTTTVEYAEKELYPLLNAMPGSYPVFLFFTEEKTPDGKTMAGRYPKTINIKAKELRMLVERVGMQNVMWK